MDGECGAPRAGGGGDADGGGCRCRPACAIIRRRQRRQQPSAHSDGRSINRSGEDSGRRLEWAEEYALPRVWSVSRAQLWRVHQLPRHAKVWRARHDEADVCDEALHRARPFEEHGRTVCDVLHHTRRHHIAIARRSGGAHWAHRLAANAAGSWAAGGQQPCGRRPCDHLDHVRCVQQVAPHPENGCTRGGCAASAQPLPSLWPRSSDLWGITPCHAACCLALPPSLAAERCLACCFAPPALCAPNMHA